jgi:hypothetical protein
MGKINNLNLRVSNLEHLKEREIEWGEEEQNHIRNVSKFSPLFHLNTILRFIPRSSL